MANIQNSSTLPTLYSLFSVHIVTLRVERLWARGIEMVSDCKRKIRSKWCDGGFGIDANIVTNTWWAAHCPSYKIKWRERDLNSLSIKSNQTNAITNHHASMERRKKNDKKNAHAQSKVSFFPVCLLTLFIVLFGFVRKVSWPMLAQKIEHLFDSTMRWFIVRNRNFYQFGSDSSRVLAIFRLL